MIKTERTNWFYDIQEVHFVKTFINCISKTKTLRRNFISIIFNSNDMSEFRKKTNYDKKIDYTSSYKKSLKKNNILHNYKTNRNKLNSWNSVTIRKCLMLIANLNRIPVENLSSMITTDFFLIFWEARRLPLKFSDLLFFSLFIFSFRIPLRWIININQYVEESLIIDPSIWGGLQYYIILWGKILSYFIFY